MSTDTAEDAVEQERNFYMRMRTAADVSLRVDLPFVFEVFS